MKLEFSPIQTTRNLTGALVNSLRQKIIEGNYPAGTKLPTAREIELQAGVSRSVVREAIASLKAEKLIISRQGIGVFVANTANERPFEINSEEFASVEKAIQILELRMAVELEMSAMAALNRTPAQLGTINRCLTEFEDKRHQGDDAVKEDMALHLAIADASGNPYFSRFIEYIGTGAIPARELVSRQSEHVADMESYLKILFDEHQAIVNAIARQDENGAREAVRQHLGSSLERHRMIAQSMQQLQR